MARLVSNAEVYSRDDGRFAFESVSEGETKLGVMKSGFPDVVLDLDVPKGPGPALEYEIVLGPSSTLRGQTAG